MEEIIRFLEDLRDRCGDKLFCRDKLLSKILISRLDYIIKVAKLERGTK